MDKNLVDGLSSGFLSNNPYFSAGFGLLGVGAGLAILRQGGRRLASTIKRQMLVTLEIPSKDKSYQWILNWISEEARKSNLMALTRMQRGARMGYFEKKIIAATNPRQLSVQTQFKQHDNGNVSADFNFVPGPGKHLFKYNQCWIQVDRVRETKMLDLVNGAPWETVTLTTLNRDREIFAEILENAQKRAIEQQEGKTVIFNSVGPEWRPFGPPRKKRLLNSVVLDKGIGESLVKDVKEFINNSKWYDDRGIPYRRGYLLYGPPGTGKTSFIQALSGELGYNICVLNLSERGHTDDRLNYLLTVAPERSIILLEDIDAAFNKVRTSNDQGGYQGSMVTFSGLLNALDGVSSSEERIIFMTTNHIERLDPALIRPGRVDYKVYLGNATDYQINAMFNRFYPSVSNDKLSEKFTSLLSNYSISTAQLQGHFVQHKADPQDAIKNVGEIISNAKRISG
ncbi:hypothetical protein BB559_003741 [Furculomyces boomerangus]|uniref:AAA+ ATPase domain-containing protein n=2 Tax=Harpellales TaxID=61421 RepID=A0A2T9Y298_9FUNG|nr:hypothetical protein BB559_006519 [Furculomyces boomerangus]PVU92378.1 hypothetical protein BB559_003741 [Furculomyces boomerangus]PWA01133.1 hypothetical protein BB558_002786 [Smittium angustum]